MMRKNLSKSKGRVAKSRRVGENLVKACGSHQGEADIAQGREILRAVLGFRAADLL